MLLFIIIELQFVRVIWSVSAMELVSVNNDLKDDATVVSIELMNVSVLTVMTNIV